MKQTKRFDNSRDIDGHVWWTAKTKTEIFLSCRTAFRKRESFMPLKKITFLEQNRMRRESRPEVTRKEGRKDEKTKMISRVFNLSTIFIIAHETWYSRMIRTGSFNRKRKGLKHSKSRKNSYNHEKGKLNFTCCQQF